MDFGAELGGREISARLGAHERELIRVGIKKALCRTVITMSVMDLFFYLQRDQANEGRSGAEAHKYRRS